MELPELPVGINGAIWAASLSVVIASAALFVNAYVARQALRTRELQLFEKVFSELLRLERDIVADDDPTKKAIALRSPFLNTLEYASLLLNHCYIREPPLRDFFSWSFQVWYREYFLAKATAEERADPKVFPELKRLYTSWTDPEGPEARPPAC